MSDVDPAEIPRDEMRDRVVFALLEAAASIALDNGLDLKDLIRLLETATYHEARKRGLLMREITDTFGISLSKASSMSRHVKAFFGRPESTHGVKRRILSLLFAEPQTSRALAKAFPKALRSGVATAIEELEESGRIVRVSGRTDRFAPAARQYRFPADSWLSRLEALRSMMVVVQRTVDARFFEHNTDAAAYVLRLRIPPDGAVRLREFYRSKLIPLLRELSDEGDEAPDGTPVRLALFWAPDQDDGE